MALIYGMSVKEFWEDNPDLFWAYRFSYYTKLEQEENRYNTHAWLQGMYICEAVSVAVNNSFSKQKVTYSKEPYKSSIEEENPQKLAQKQKIEQENLVNRIKSRIKEVQAIKGEEKK